MDTNSAAGAALTMLMERAPARTSFYGYAPSMVAAAVGTALFGVASLIMIYQTIRHKAWIWFAMVLAVLMEFVGFAARIYSANNVLHRPSFIIQYCLILLAPVVIAGAIYVAFGRLVLQVVPPAGRTIGLLWVPVRWLTPIFVTFDIAALLIQVIGALMLVNTLETDPDFLNKTKKGRDIAMAGVTLQIVAFGIFCVVCIRFHITSRKYKKEQSRVASSDKFGPPAIASGKKYLRRWWWLLYTIEAACLLVLVRSIFREVEFNELAYGGGKNGAIHTQEFWMYLFDAAPMWIVVVLFLNVTPGAYAPLSLRMPKEYVTVESTERADSQAFIMDSYHESTPGTRGQDPENQTYPHAPYAGQGQNDMQALQGSQAHSYHAYQGRQA